MHNKAINYTLHFPHFNRQASITPPKERIFLKPKEVVFAGLEVLGLGVLIPIVLSILVLAGPITAAVLLEDLEGADRVDDLERYLCLALMIASTLAWLTIFIVLRN